MIRTDKWQQTSSVVLMLLAMATLIDQASGKPRFALIGKRG